MIEFRLRCSRGAKCSGILSSEGVAKNEYFGRETVNDGYDWRESKNLRVTELGIMDLNHD